MTTGELDEAAERFIRSQGGEPVFKGYRGFPGSICASPNSMVVHGIPGSYALKRGDVLSVDIGVRARRLGRRRRRDPADRPGQPGGRGRLLDTTAGRALRRRRAVPCRATGWATSRPPIQRRVEADGYSVIRSLVGHGVGRDMHEDPQIPNFGKPGTGPELEEGMVLAIEPMVNAGGHEVRMGADGWAVYSQDGSLAAHFEHTVAITADGPRILTPWHEVTRRSQAVPAQGRRAGLSQRLPAMRIAIFPGWRFAVSWADTPVLSIRKVDPTEHEGPSLGQAHVREVQGNPPQRRGSRDLPEPPAQAAAGLTQAWHGSQASTFPSTRGSR